MAALRILTIYGDIFGERVLGNLLNHSTFCESCGLACIHCRNAYPSFAEDIVDVISMPTNLPPFLEDPEKHFPKKPHDCDIVLAIGLHLDLLTHIPKIAQKTGARAVVVPIENRSWCPLGLKKQIENELDDLGVESAFPKPFCTFDADKGLIGDFRRDYMLGRPKLEVTVEKDMIEGFLVLRSAPCGSTWYVAQQVKWHKTRELREVVAKAHHAYPCTASMETDPELGDALLHVAGYAIREAVLEAVKRT